MDRVKLEANEKGFTLVELMVTILISVIVSAVIYRMYENQQSLHKQQQAVVDMQQNGRASIYLMGQEFRMAGFDPLEIGGTGIQDVPFPSSTNIRYTQDLNRDNDVADANESVELNFNPPVLPGTGNITRDTGGGAQPFLDNIDFFELVYFMNNGNFYLTPPAGTLDQVESIQITMLVRSAISQPNFVNTLTFASPPPFNSPINAGVAYNDGFRRRLITTRIQLRNASL